MDKRQGISQEGLKWIACISMLIDHIAASGLYPGLALRLVGRIAFPIFCFLLAEGVYHTRNPRRYALRLFIGLLLSEIPYELALFGRMTTAHQSVMVTLFLGFLLLQAMKCTSSFLLKLAMVIPFAWAADFLHSDYGSSGVLLIAVFSLIRDMPRERVLCVVCLGLFCVFAPSRRMLIFGCRVPTELFAMAALIPISAYTGRKTSNSRVVQWMFYLFYPAHLAILALLRSML